MSAGYAILYGKLDWRFTEATERISHTCSIVNQGRIVNASRMYGVSISGIRTR